ncbi:MAG: methionyl-tRNA formyltransferase [Bacteroidetes bacterium]|nr:methionyl-tRNA formyltransferase [Bacteroidota bacterium]
MGTPEFAVDTLEALIHSTHKVVGVVTAPDRPQGRGLKLVPSDVKVCAEKYSLPVLQPEKLKDPEFLKQLSDLQADLFVVVAFRMLPEVVWRIPPKGTYNLHGSLLPQYRGAAPINWAIINGEKETGVTTFRIQQEIDTGNILFQEKIKIEPTDDAGSVYDKLRVIGASLMARTVDAIALGTAKEIPQPVVSGNLRPAPKIFRETCQINWDQSTESVRNFIRGLSPYPGAWTKLRGQNFKVFSVETVHPNEPIKPIGEPGEIKSDFKTFLKIKTTDGWISVLNLQPEGKKRMNVDEFLRGNKLE